MLKWWCRHASARSPNHSRSDIEKVTGYYATLYQREDLNPPGRPFTTHFTPFRFNKYIIWGADVEAAVCQPRLNNSDGNTHLRAEHFNKWLQEAYPAE